MFTQVGTFITGWFWNPYTQQAESFGGFVFNWLSRLFG